LLKRPFVTLGLVLAGGCGGPSLDPSASESVERLPPGPQRSAGDAIVAYETAVRAKDAATLCRRVLFYEGAPSNCERSWRSVLDQQESIAIDVQSIEVRGPKATAHVKGTRLLPDGKLRVEEDTLQLVRVADGWRLAIGD